MHNFIFKKVSSKEEMEKSYAIRTKVFCEEQKISKEIEFDNLDHLCSHFLIFDDKKVIATARVRQKEENILKIERVAVLFEFRRLKVGSTLIKKIIQYFTNLNEILSYFGLDYLESGCIFTGQEKNTNALGTYFISRIN